jgi:hypothetical protein
MVLTPQTPSLEPQALAGLQSLVAKQVMYCWHLGLSLAFWVMQSGQLAGMLVRSQVAPPLLDELLEEELLEEELLLLLEELLLLVAVPPPVPPLLLLVAVPPPVPPLLLLLALSPPVPPLLEEDELLDELLEDEEDDDELLEDEEELLDEVLTSTPPVPPAPIVPPVPMAPPVPILPPVPSVPPVDTELPGPKPPVLLDVDAPPDPGASGFTPSAQRVMSDAAPATNIPSIKFCCKRPRASIQSPCG